MNVGCILVCGSRHTRIGMDFYKFRLLLLILSAVGCCYGDLLPPNISGIVGRNITFPTTLPESTTGVASVTWTFKSPTKTQLSAVYTRLNINEKIGESYVGRVRCNITTFELQLGPLTSMDGGIYSLSVVTLDLNTLTAETTLQVLDAVADVKIVSNVSEAVEINSTVGLTCTAKGSMLSYTWTNGSAPVTVDGQHVMIQGNQLTISNVLRGDLRGPIYCTVNNKLEAGTSPAFNLTVHYGPENVVMTRVPIDSDLKKGSNLTLSCSAQCSPPATISWFLNGGVLPEKSDTLFLSSLKEEHSGNYTCLAYNSKTMRYTASQVATVTVLEGISGTSITGPTTQLIAGNSAANLTCQSQQGKVDSVVWLKDDKPLVTTPGVLLSSDQSTVSITTVQKEDAGKYRCQLKNRVSITEGIYTMVVYYGPENVKIEGPKQVEIVDPVVIKCLAASVPKPTYTWKLNGSLLSENTAVLNFSHLDYMKSGYYTCEVLNPITGLNQTASHNLQVKGEGELHDQLSNGAVAAIVITVLVILAVIIAVIIHKKRKVSDIPSPY